MAVLDAVERLQLSRQRLRMAMRPAPASASSSGPGAGRRAGPLGAWMDSLRANPASRLVLEAVQSWWAQHPLHLAGVVLTDGARSLIQPVAKRHPWALLLTGLVLGAVVIKVKPWRWMAKPAMLAGLVTSMASGVMARLPAQSWLSIIAALTPKPDRASTAPASAARDQPAKAFTGL